MRLFIGTPTQSTWSPEFGHSLSWLMSDLAGNPAGLELVHPAWMDCTLLPGLRMDLASRALEMGATHILWTDCDMKFKPKSVRALFDHSELDIVVDWVYWEEHEAENLSLPKSNRLWECMNIIKQIIEEKEEHGK